MRHGTGVAVGATLAEALALALGDPVRDGAVLPLGVTLPLPVALGEAVADSLAEELAVSLGELEELAVADAETDALVDSDALRLAV